MPLPLPNFLEGELSLAVSVLSPVEPLEEALCIHDRTVSPELSKASYERPLHHTTASPPADEGPTNHKYTSGSSPHSVAAGAVAWLPGPNSLSAHVSVYLDLIIHPPQWPGGQQQPRARQAQTQRQPRLSHPHPRPHPVPPHMHKHKHNQTNNRPTSTSRTTQSAPASTPRRSGG